MTNERGKLVGEPLLHGSRFCSIHAQIFQYEPAIITSPTLLFFLDFETTGLEQLTVRTRVRACTHAHVNARINHARRLDVLVDHIVEIGLLECEGSAVFNKIYIFLSKVN